MIYTVQIKDVEHEKKLKPLLLGTKDHATSSGLSKVEMEVKKENTSVKNVRMIYFVTNHSFFVFVSAYRMINFIHKKQLFRTIAHTYS